MFARLVEDFCQFDDFCQAFGPHREARLLSRGTACQKRGPQAGLADSEIMTILVLYPRSNFSNFQPSYEGVVLTLLRSAFPKAPCYARFIAFTNHVWVPLTVFLLTRMGRRTRSTTSTARHCRCVTRVGSTATGCLRLGRAGQNQHRLVFRLQAASGVQR